MPATNARTLDQFYTQPEYAKIFFQSLQHYSQFQEADWYVEPSAGQGSFFDLMDPLKRIGLDIDPKGTGLLQQDFLTWSPTQVGTFVTIGNPPFGKNTSLAVKFFNHAAKFSTMIAFIVPRTFRKESVVRRLNPYWHKVQDADVTEYSFTFEGMPKDVTCCAQVWLKKDERRLEQHVWGKKDVENWFRFTRNPDEADFAIQRVGARAGLIRVRDFKGYSRSSHYFICAHGDSNAMLKRFQMLEFGEVKNQTAGNPSISIAELIGLWMEGANVDGFPT